MQFEQDYRKALSQFATGVALVSAYDKGEAKAMTINSFASVSLEPRLVLWSLDKKSNRFDLYAHAERYAIHILAADQRDEAMHYAKHDSLEGSQLDWVEGRHGAPICASALARFECQRSAVHEGGDHIIIVGEVLHFETLDKREALVFHNSQFSTL